MLRVTVVRRWKCLIESNAGLVNLADVHEFPGMQFLRQTQVVTLLLLPTSLVFLVVLYLPVVTRNGLSRQLDVGEESPVFTISMEKVMDGPVTMEQDDPALLQLVRRRYIHPASVEEAVLTDPYKDPSMGQSDEIRKILGNLRNGFFVECGALDGETRSNSLMFERQLGWTGVLIEADPNNFALMQKKKRRAWTVNACLSTFPYPTKVFFKQNFNLGRIAGLRHDLGTPKKDHVLVQCLPLYTILAALEVPTVHYFSLDVEGNELEVLRTIPWDKIDIQTLSVEYIHGKEGKEALREYMENQGYQVFSEVSNSQNLANDYIFVKKTILATIQQ